MNLDREDFFDDYRAQFGPIKKQSQVEGLTAILDAMAKDESLRDLRHAAYMLATVRHECADTYYPIEEIGKGVTREYGKIITVKDSKGVEHANVYYGRGYVQLTWSRNYRLMGEKLGMVDTMTGDNALLLYPELALKPDVAYKIMSKGMLEGTFTNAPLRRYINGDKVDYIHARRVINGLDCSDKIATYAEKFEHILRGALM